MDVHKESYTLCCYSFATDKIEYTQTISADYRLILKYLEQVRKHYPEDASFVCGYEAGCLGYSLFRQLTNHGVECKILAPTTMAVPKSNRVKTDRRDATKIAQCLAFHTYQEVYVPDEEDNQVKEFIRMRDDHKLALKKNKQQILAFTLRKGLRFDAGKTYWTKIHLKWLRSLELDELDKETLSEYLNTYDYLTNKIERLDQRIEELAATEKYQEKVKNLGCLLGIKTHTALSLVVEIGDFARFAKAKLFSSFLGLVPSEASSGDSINRYGITKAGNGHLRKLLVEAAQSYARGTIGHKSAALKKRQKGCDVNLIAYADKANERLRRKFYRLTIHQGVNRNKAITAVARELSCFVWGIMTQNIV